MAYSTSEEDTDPDNEDDSKPEIQTILHQHQHLDHGYGSRGHHILQEGKASSFADPKNKPKKSWLPSFQKASLNP